MRVSLLVAGEVNKGPLLRVLHELNIDDVWVLHNDLGDRFMLDPAPDFVVGVLSDRDSDAKAVQNKTFTNGEVALRLGLAAGKGVPTLVIASPSTQMRSPDPLITVVRCPIKRDALVGHLWAFTTSLSLSPSSDATAPPERQLENADHYLSELDRLEWGSTYFGDQFERLISRLLLSAGAAVVETESAGPLGDRVDIAFMPSGRSGDIILVELKAGNISEKQLAAAEEQLQRYVIGRQAKYGIVLYHDVSGRMLSSHHSTPLILRMPARELIQKLANDPLPKVLDDAVGEAAGRM